MNEQLEIELEFFRNFINKEFSMKKKKFHYNSISNLTNAIKSYNLTEANNLKISLLNYFEKLKESQYDLTKLKSAELYKQYLLPVGQYLIHKENFKTKMNLKFLLLVGVLVDLSLFFYFKEYFYPIFTIIFYLYGYLERKKSIKEDRFFSIFW